METVIEEILSKVFKWHRFLVNLKAEAVLLYFKKLSLRKVKKFLLHESYEVSIETIREWFHAVGKALQAIYTTVIWVYEIKYKTANEPLEEREIMWVEAIDKLLEDESLKKTTQKKLSKKLGLLGLKKLFKIGRRS